MTNCTYKINFSTNNVVSPNLIPPYGPYPKPFQVKPFLKLCFHGYNFHSSLQPFCFSFTVLYFVLRFHTYFTPASLPSNGSLSVSLPSCLTLPTVYKYWQNLDDWVEVSLNPSFFCALFFCLIFFFFSFYFLNRFS